MKTNVYEAAGEAAMMDVLREIDAALDKKADLDMFQLESLLAIIKNEIAPLILLAMDPKLPFIYLAMKKMIESLIDNKKKAQREHEQKEYAYGFPAAEEMAYEQGAFDFTPY